MKAFALSFLLIVSFAVIALTILDLVAIQELSATQVFEKILELQEHPSESGEIARLAANQVVFGERVYQRWLFQVSTLGFVLFLLFVFFSWMGYKRLILPLRTHYQDLLKGVSLQIDQQEFQELRLLVGAFIEAQQQLRERERSEVAKYVVHQMKNLWTPVAMVSSLLKSQTDPQQQREMARLLEEQTLRLNRLLSLFKGIYTFPDPSPRDIDLGELAQEIGRSTGIPVQFLNEAQASNAARVHADEVLLSQALENLVLNAWEAQDKSGPPIEVVLKDAGIEIRDRGCGFSGSTKQKGLGLGLEFTKKVAQVHGWTLVWRDRRGGGAEVAMEKQFP